MNTRQMVSRPSRDHADRQRKEKRLKSGPVNTTQGSVAVLENLTSTVEYGIFIDTNKSRRTHRKRGKPKGRVVDNK